MLTKEESDTLLTTVKTFSDQLVEKLNAMTNLVSQEIHTFMLELPSPDEEIVRTLSHKELKRLNPADRADYLRQRSKIRSKHNVGR